jgi:ATP-dependent protease Clp ATPase subunit
VAPRGPFCTFCGKAQHEVRRLVGDPSLKAFACNECVEGFANLLAAEGVEPFCHMNDNVVKFPKRESK